jgi:alpha-tubulin suppressor-like RCC1 family protein
MKESLKRIAVRWGQSAGILVWVVLMACIPVHAAPGGVPVIQVTPVGRTVKEREPLWLAVGAEGQELKYQWYKDGVAIEGATGEVCHLGPAQKVHSGTYTVQVSNAAGTLAPTDPVTVAVDPNAYSGTAVIQVPNALGTEYVPAVIRSNIVDVSLGHDYHALLTTGGAVLSWTVFGAKPVTLPAEAGTNILAISAGDQGIAALRDDGRALYLLASNALPPEFEVNVAAITAGSTHVLGVKRDGSLIAAGSNQEGETTVPAEVSRGVVAVAAGYRLSMALKWDGTVSVWGRDVAKVRFIPPEIQGHVVKIAAGAGFLAAQTDSGAIRIWGDTIFNVTPPPPSPSPVVSFRAGGYGFWCRRADGSTFQSGQSFVFKPNVEDAYELAISSSQYLKLVTVKLPELTSVPASARLVEGQTRSFSLGVRGYWLNYQWSRNGVEIPGATNATYTVSPAGLADSGDYSVVVTNPVGSVPLPSPVRLEVLPLRPFPVGGGSGSLLIVGANSAGELQVPANAQSGIVSVAAGEAHVVALKSDGSTLTWGTNSFGLDTVPAAEPKGSLAIGASGYHSMRVTPAGQTLLWGAGDSGQSQAPQTLVYNVVDVAAGADFSMVLHRDGSVGAWGGHVTTVAAVPVAAQTGVIRIAGGGGHALALKSDGTVVAWGDNTFGQTAAPTSPATAIAAGLNHSVALLSDGSVVAWGDNRQGQTSTPAAARFDIVAIAAGNNHTVALRRDGTALCWGASDQGQLDIPSDVQGTILAVAAGGNHTMILYSEVAPTLLTQPEGGRWIEGRLAFLSVSARAPMARYQWSKDGVVLPGATNSLLPLGVLRPDHAGSYTVSVQNNLGSITSQPAVVSVIRPPDFDGAAIAVGNAAGAVLPVEAQSGVRSVAVGANNAAVVRTNGSVFVWGDNTYGQNQVPDSASSGVLQVGLGQYHGVALKLDNTVVAWGAGSDPSSTLPNSGEGLVPESARSGITAIAVGDSHSLALTREGAVIAWGYPGNGRTSVPDAARNGVVAIAAGRAHSIALRNDGSVVAWGAADQFQTVVPAVAKWGVVAVFAAGDRSLVLKQDGSAWVFGNSLLAPLRLPGAVYDGAESVAMGNTFTLVRRGDDSLGFEPASMAGSIPSFARSQVMNMAAYGGSGLLVIPPIPPSLVSGPTNQGVFVGQTVVLSAQATGYPLRYQWRRDGVDIPGAQSATLNLGLIQPSQAGSYSVVVSNAAGTAASDPTQRLAVNPSAGTVVLWGDTTYGDRGRIPDAARSGVIAIAMGDQHVLALRIDGTVVSWGGSAFGNGRLAVPPEATNVMAIAAGLDHSLAVTREGSVLAWGSSSHGQTVVPAAANSGVVDVRAGWEHSLALRADGSVVAWGDNRRLQCQVPSAALSDVVAISAAGNRSLALRRDGSVVEWGSGRTNLVPVPPEAQSGVVAIAAGPEHTLALKQGGSVFAWITAPSALASVPAEAKSGVVSIFADSYTAIAVKGDGSLVLWGDRVLPPKGMNGFVAAIVGPATGIGLLGSPLQLHTERTGDGINLTWSTNATTLRLQSTARLIPSSGWTDLTLPVSSRDAQFVVPVSPEAASGFFRLVSP